jgi:uncharacterized protein (DUF924 family)
MTSTLSSPVRDILDFWFLPEGAPGHGQPRREWFRKDPAFDAEIARRFGSLVEEALSGGLADWQPSPEAALARILLLDQFTRNMFRGDAQAFSGDALALAAAQDMLAREADLMLAPVQRWFVYLPFEHAESLAAQGESVTLFAALNSHGEFADAYDYALRHYHVIRRFGRFPHRNALLGRASTPEELAFLEQPGSWF